MSLIRSGFFILFMHAVIALLQPVYADDILVINTTGNPPLNTPDQSGFMDKVAAEAMRRINVKLETVQLPAERGLKNANAGIDDGEMSRIAGLQKHYPNLIQVPETIMNWEFHAFSVIDMNSEDKWSNLAGHSVAFIRGWKIVERNIPDSSTRTLVKNPDQLFGLFKKQRTEIVVYERWGGLKLLEQLQMLNVKIIDPPLAQKKMYMYLHKKHRDLVPLLSDALKAMKEDGTYQRIYDEVLGRYDK